MSAKTLGFFGLGLVVLAGAAGTVYYLFSVVPKNEALERSYRGHLERGVELLDLKHDGSGALAELKEASKIFPDRLEPRVAMGRALSELARYSEAIEILGGLADARPGPELEAQISLCLGKAFVARFRDTKNHRDLGEAKMNLDRATQGSATKAEALFNLGALYLSSWQMKQEARDKPSFDDPDLDKAKKYWDQAFAIDRESELAQTFRKPYERFFERKAPADPDHP